MFFFRLLGYLWIALPSRWGTIFLQNVDKNLHPRKLESCVDIEQHISLKRQEISQADAVKSF
jgi:hypothetical protein